ncbi:hypothetical protein [Enhygromyxa salina]|uniref:hypothetical protein n=1 Tax=Enhygromyxa salina TaxID=215803 RepID=UPI0011B25B05|nr:hypothetical protein [Enhygromyxa salina]
MLSYAADEDIEICPATIPYLEQWMIAIADKLGIPEHELTPTTYYLVDQATSQELCEGGDLSIHCADHVDGQVNVYAYHPMNRHELVHAVTAGTKVGPPFLEEGLATLLDDGVPVDLMPSIDAEDLDDLIELQDPRDQLDVYGVAAYILYWVAQRHGLEALAQLRFAVEAPTSAAAFRAAFEATLGESLDEMLAEVEGQPGCQLVTCIGEPTPWVDGQWTTYSPTGCEGGAIGVRQPEGDHILRHAIVEIAETGIYEISTPSHGVFLDACEQPCSFNHSFGLSVGSHDYPLAAGRYRVETWSAGPGQPTYDVQIRLAE